MRMSLLGSMEPRREPGTFSDSRRSEGRREGGRLENLLIVVRGEDDGDQEMVVGREREKREQWRLYTSCMSVLERDPGQ